MADRQALRQGLLLQARPAPQPVALPDGSTVWVRTLTAYDSHRSQQLLAEQAKLAGGDESCATGRILALLLCDEAGELLFDLASAEDVLALSQLPPPVSRAIFAVHNRVNAATDAEAADLGNG